MRNKYILISVLIFVLLSSNVFAAINIIHSDNFDRATPGDNWTITAGVTIDSNRLKLADTSGAVIEAISELPSLPIKYNVTYNFMQTATAKRGFVCMLDTNSSFTRNGENVYLKTISGGIMRGDDNVNFYTYSASTWYNIRKEVDLDNSTYTVYIDEVLKRSDIPFTDAAKIPAYFGLQTHDVDSGYDIFIDNLTISNFTAAATNETRLKRPKNNTAYPINSLPLFTWTEDLKEQGNLTYQYQLFINNSNTTFFNSTVNTTFINIENITGLIDEQWYNWRVCVGNETDVSIKCTGFYNFRVGVFFQECSNITSTFFNFTIFDESKPNVRLNASLNAILEYYPNDETDNKVNYTFVFNHNNSYLLCLNGEVSSLTAEAYIRYNVTNSFLHKYYITNFTFFNRTNNISLYNYNNVTGLSNLRTTVRDRETYVKYRGITTWLQRFYPGDNLWRTVQMDRTGDFGLASFNIQEAIIDYRLIFIDQAGRPLKTTDTLKFACDVDGVCDITILLSPFDTTITPNDILITNNIANVEAGIDENLTINYVSPTGLSKDVRVQVINQRLGDSVSLCDLNQSGIAGSFNCPLSGQSGAFEVRVFQSLNLTDFLTADGFSKPLQSLGSILSNKFTNGAKESIMWSSFITIFFVSAGLFVGAGSGVIVIIMAVFSFIMNGFLGFITFGSLATSSIVVILGVIVSLIIKK